MRMRHFVLSVSLAAIGGCSIGVDEPAGEHETLPERRQKIGKADLWGSCDGPGNSTHCGHKSKGNCYCDKACIEFGDCCADYHDICGAGEDGTCDELGGTCLSSPIDVTFPANCESDFGMQTVNGACAAFNQSCCKGPECQPVMCTLFCAYGFAKGPDGCEICSCVQPEPCGGFANFPCPEGKTCIDDPTDDCDPQNGGADCGGICVEPPDAPPSCNGYCGGAAPGKACYCDAVCTQYNDCCADYLSACGTDRTPASGFCVKSSNEACTTDADCVTGGCGGELCYNPAFGGGISTCECAGPGAPVKGCGCVDNKCTWYN